MIELLYCLFLLSGLVKSFLHFYASGIMVVDFTLLCALMLVGAYILQFSKNFYFRNTFFCIKSSRPVIFMVLVFYSWMVISLLYTPSPGYSYIKTFIFLTDLLAIVFPFIYRGFNPVRFFHFFAYLGSGLIFIYSALLPNVYANYLRYSESREFVVKYLDVGFLAGIMILVLAFVCPRMKPWLKLLLIGVNAWSLLISSARGPMVFLLFVLFIKFVVSFVIFMSKTWTLNIKSILYAIGGIGFLGAAVYYIMDKYALLLERSINRLLMLLDMGSGSVAERFSQIYFSFDTIFKNAVTFLFGSGIGSFGILYEGIDKRNYPHNVILEIWFELGAIGLILFLLLLFVYFRKIRVRLNYILIFTYLLLNSLKSYSLIDLRIMFGILSVLLIIERIRNNKNNQKLLRGVQGGSFLEKSPPGRRRQGKTFKVCQMTSVHQSMDTRIFYKECRSLVRAGYDVTLIANHNKTKETVDGIKIISFPSYRNRFARILLSPLRMFRMARKQRADIYHFHDPELIITGLLLKCIGAKVIFDIHENIIKQIKTKDFLWFSSFFSRLFTPLNYICAKCFHLVLAENSYEDIYKKYTHRYKTVLNMPDIGFFEPYYIKDRSGFQDIFYIGRVTKLRGVDVALEALYILKKKGINIKMHFVGYIDPVLKKELENLEYFDQIKESVIFYGKLKLEEGYEIAKQCFLGISILKPVENYLYSYSTKIFEYMAVGMPLITSDFELYKNVVETHGSGICIDPTRADVLAEQINYLLTHRNKAMEMGMKGREAAIKEFNWEKGEKVLIDFYREISGTQ